jgi:hypothetical protein
MLEILAEDGRVNPAIRENTGDCNYAIRACKIFSKSIVGLLSAAKDSFPPWFRSFHLHKQFCLSVFIADYSYPGHVSL